MRYLRKQVYNRRAPYDQRLYIDATDSIVTTNSNNLILPNSSNAISNPVKGMIRYNSSNDEVEVYQGSSASWRSMRFKESTQITQQNLGSGDGTTVLFGPLSPTPPTVVQSGATWGPQNLLVLIENVPQVANTNYIVVQNSFDYSEKSTGTLSVAAALSATTLYFNSALNITSVSGNGTTVTLTLLQVPTNTQVPFAVGATITGSSTVPSGYNASSVAVTASSVSVFSNTAGFITGGTLTMTGTATGTPAVGGVITGTGIGSNTYITSVNSATFTCTISTTTMTVSAISAGTLSVGMFLTGGSVTAGTYISALGTGFGGTGTYTLNQSASGSPTTGTSYSINKWQTVTSTAISGIVSSVSYANTTTGTATTLGSVASSTAIYIDGNITGSVVSGTGLATSTLSSVVITGVTGTFSCATASLIVGQTITISGTLGGTGSISSYSNPTTYYIIATNGTTNFQLSASYNGTPITTTAGTPTGLTYTYSTTTVSSFVTDPNTNALLSIGLSTGTTATIAINSVSLTITEQGKTTTGYYLKFSSPVTLGKPITVLHGFDK